MSDKPSFGELCWNELSTPDVKAAKEFYGKLFGWEFEDHDMGDMTYTMVKVKGKRACAGFWAIPKEMQGQIPPNWMSYISVENVEKSLEQAVKLGAKVMKPASDAGTFGRFAIIVDPTGAAFALWQNIPH